MKFLVTAKKTENRPFDPTAPNWYAPIQRTYEADSKWKAKDAFLHDLFAEAKKNGFRIHHRDGSKEICFVGDFNVYGHEEITYRKYVMFDTITVKEIVEDESSKD